MAEAFRPEDRDQRTFGAQQARLINDLNRPDLDDVVTDYLQDAMRYFQRRPFFFTETDNKRTPRWRPSWMYPQGATIRQAVCVCGGDCRCERLEYVFVAVSEGVKKSADKSPRWTANFFTTPPGSGVYPPPPLDVPGVVSDGHVIWANVGLWQRGLWTNLSTVYNINEYVPPIDWVAPYQVQLTTANLRLILQKISFDELSSYDVIRPPPISAYPRMWAWWKQEIFLWVYPNGFYPFTLSYYSGPAVVTDADDSNYWTTQAERLVRKYAQASISREVLYDQQAAQLAMAAVGEELSQLKSQVVSQNGYAIPAGDW